MNTSDTDDQPSNAGAYGVNYALRPHKFIDRRVFLEALNRFSLFKPLEDHAYVGLGSFALEDHKLINATYGIQKLLSLEINMDVVKRQQFNLPLSCIYPSAYSTSYFVENRHRMMREMGAQPDDNLIVWFDMTDHETLRVHLDTFRSLLRTCTPGDVVRYTVDVDPKTLGSMVAGETTAEKEDRWYATLKALLGEQFDPQVRPQTLRRPLGITRLVLRAFELIAEDAFAGERMTYAPISITTYADGHRMLSITGAVVEVDDLKVFRSRVDALRSPGQAKSWDDLVNIQIPQLTIWERLYLDREIGKSPPGRIAKKLGFRFHETIETTQLLKGYSAFQRFYPNFRHVLL